MTATEDPGPTRRRAQLPSEALLALTSLVAVAGFTHLFAEDWVVLGLLVAVVVAHLTNAVARRRGLGALLTAGVVGLVAVLQVSAVLYPHVSWIGLPTPETVSAAVDDLRQAWNLFGEVRAPAPAERGFLVAATGAIWVAVSLADWAGLRLRATAEAVLPAAALFTFTILLAPGSSVPGATALALTILGFALAQRTARAATDDTWVGGQAGAGVVALARMGALAIGVAALAAGILVPRLPMTGSEALVGWPGEDGAGRTTVSPLVDIRSRLVQQSDAIAFTVRADRPAYWRLTSLDHFDGVLWSSSTSFSDADGRLPSDPPDATTRDLVQSYSIAALGTIWAPAALTPLEVQTSTTDLRWNADLATLIVPGTVESIDGTEYEVLSRVPEFTPADLAAPIPDPLPDDLAAATELPPDLPPEVAALAAQVTADADDTPYGKARALQDWFRREFTYDLAGVGVGHGTNAIRDFLAARRGYCEQFAGTYAAMARSLGLPARVAVGYTPGEVDATGITYTVRGRNAHAWPEVFIPGAGWVPFEPTPSRGQPGTEAYTGVAPAQDDAEPPIPVTPTTLPAPSPSTSSTVVPADRPATSAPDRSLLAGDGDPDRDADGGFGLTRVVAIVAASLGVLVLADVVGLAVLRALRRRRRRRVRTVPGRIRNAWADTVAATSRLGPPPVPTETDAEYAARAAPVVGPAGPALTHLATLVTRAAWAPGGDLSDPALAAEADGLAGQVGDEVRRRLTWTQRLQGWVDPRPALRSRWG